MIFETHAHYDDRAFDKDRVDLLKSLPENGIGADANAGSSLSSIETIRELTKQYSYVYGAVGIHPCDTGDLTEERFAWLKKQCADEKIVAVGEIGLDYHWNDPHPEIQKTWFVRQLLMAQEVHLPVIIHSREAANDTLTIMRENHAERSGGVIHCFSYSVEMAAEFLKMDYYFGIGGVVTFENAKKLKEAVRYIPTERILLETDSPYLAPAPYRGKRNSSLYLPYIAEEIGRIKGMTAAEVIRCTEENAVRLFGVTCVC